MNKDEAERSLEEALFGSFGVSTALGDPDAGADAAIQVSFDVRAWRLWISSE